MHSRRAGNRGEAVGRYVQPSVLAAAVLGMGVSIYLTSVHFAQAPLVCSVNGAVDCEKVLSSGYGVIAGTAVPTSAAGIIWFAVAAAAALLRLHRTQVAWSALGMLTVLFLIYVEIVQLGAVCLWCSAAHALVFVIFLLTVTVPVHEK